jgi:hypothetical protein
MLKRTAVFVFILALFSLPVRAGQVVSVQSPLEGENSLSEVENKLISEAFETALNLEVKEMLGVNPPPLLKNKLLLPHMNELIMSYSEVGRTHSDTSLELEIEVQIDRDFLRKQLKGSGYYYTAYNPIVFELKTSGLDPEDRQQIDQLKAMSGMRSRPGADPLLSITKDGNKRFKARLEYKDESLVAVHRDPQELWFNIWSKYFSQKDVRDEFVYSLRLSIGGWPTVEAMRMFDQRFSDWNKAVEKKQLVEVTSEYGRLSGKWRVETRDVHVLQKRLAHFSEKRALDFKLVSIKEQNF